MVAPASRILRLQRWLHKMVKVQMHQAAQHTVLGLLIFILATFVYLSQSSEPSLRLSGTPVSKLIDRPGDEPSTAYYGVNTRFVLFNSWYGQLNNQIIALINAISVARRIDGVLVLPCEKLGRESRPEREALKQKRLYSTRELVGDYFNYSLLASAVHAVRPSEFLQSPDGNELSSRKNVVVCRKCVGFYNFLLTGSEQGPYPGEPGVRVLNPNSSWPTPKSWCDFRPEKALPNLQKLYRRDRFVLLPNMFRHHNLNCTESDPEWLQVRKHLRPRDEFLHAVNAFMDTLQRPILAIHLRFFLNGDIGQFTPRSFVNMLQSVYVSQMEKASTLFISYAPSSTESVQILQLLKKEFQGTVVGGEAIPDFLNEQVRMNITSLPLASVLMDMWVSVKSDMFLGRLGSSLSWNVVYWRQVLKDEYGLQSDNITPSWYTLEMFTTTGAARAEGKSQRRRWIS